MGRDLERGKHYRVLPAAERLRMQRLVDFNTMLRQVNQLIASVDNYDAMLQAFCDIAVRYGHLTLAFIAQPDASGNIIPVAVSGAVGYIDGLHISINADTPEGRGSAGQAWRSGRGQYNQVFDEAPGMAPWAERAHRFGIRSSATILIRIHGEKWGILSIYHGTSNIFDDDLKELFEQLARDIAFGLERLQFLAQRQQYEERLRHQALHDSLTGLPNRRALERHLEEMLSQADDHKLVGVGMLDLDDFKAVNDLYGHDLGDRLLQEFISRLRSRLRPEEFLARLGGDEFVVVLNALQIHDYVQRIENVAARLHGAVAEPFPFDQIEPVELTMSCGIALSRIHASDGEQLLRYADAVLYQLKSRKTTRAQWWQIGLTDSVDTELPETFDPYGVDAAALLDKNAILFETVGRGFAAQLAAYLNRYAHLMADGETSTHHITLFTESQQRHFRDVFRAGMQPDALRQSAEEIGRTHALMGISGVGLMQAHGLYQQLVMDEIARSIIAARDRYRLSVVVDSRLRTDLGIQVQAVEGLSTQYFHRVHLPNPDSAMRWADVVASEMAGLADLPGVVGVFLMRQDDQGTITVEHSAGPLSGEGKSGVTHLIGDHELPCQNLRRDAWQDHAVRRRTHAESQAIEGSMGNGTVRSHLVVPIIDEMGHTVSLVELWGSYPYQFESPWMHRFASGLQQRWQDFWKRRTRTETVVAEDLAREYRMQLFGGGLRIYVQPVLDLTSGEVIRYEVLARLELPDQQIISPGVFLPLLGDSELEQLFLLTVDMALATLKLWESNGMHTRVSVNAAPTTIVHPEFPRWVKEVLSKHQMEPGRLAIEVLESHQVDAQVQRETLARLRDMGIHLAMDDLGAGYSSLLRLMDNPFHTFKVDAGVVKNIYEKPIETLILIDTLVRLGKDMGRSVVIEGLEDRGMLEAATVLGARYGQGYVLARPMPVERAMTWKQTFGAPVPVHDIKTFIGAMAYQWKMANTPPYRHAGDLDSCPVAEVLRKAGAGDATVGEWHQMMHSADEGEEAGQRLVEWLAKHIQRA